MVNIDRSNYLNKTSLGCSIILKSIRSPKAKNFENLCLRTQKQKWNRQVSALRTHPKLLFQISRVLIYSDLVLNAPCSTKQCAIIITRCNSQVQMNMTVVKTCLFLCSPVLTELKNAAQKCRDRKVMQKWR